MDRRTFLSIGAAGALAAAEAGLEAKIPTPLKDLSREKGLKIRFMGTGAAGGKGEDGLGRRHSSILVNDDFIIDLTDESLDMIPAGLHPTTLFYTHSHRDHFQPSAALQLGIRKVYLSHTWSDVARWAFRQAARESGAEMPEIIPTYFGVPVQEGAVTITPLDANHPTENEMEQAQLYLLEKDGVRLLYATDTGGIPGRSARLIGIDKHKPGYGITALIMEATSADPDDIRLFCHSSTDLVAKTVRVLQKTNRLHMAEGQRVYITHMARSLHPKDMNAGLPDPLRAPDDGEEVVFRTPDAR